MSAWKGFPVLLFNIFNYYKMLQTGKVKSSEEKTAGKTFKLRQNNPRDDNLSQKICREKA
jgi:hypothetical protein